MVSKSVSAFAEQRAEVGLLHRRRRILARPWRVERITTRLNRILDVASLAAGAQQVLEAIVMGLELAVGDAPILNCQVWIEDLFAVTLFDVRLIDEVGDLEAEGLAVPMHERAAETRARQKARPAADGKCGFVR